MSRMSNGKSSENCRPQRRNEEDRLWIGGQSSMRGHKKAISDYTEAIRLNPQDAGAYFSRSSAYEQIGKKFKAKEEFAKAKKLGYNPNP
jgi:tetratricopeptide (TPR) repeat protein